MRRREEGEGRRRKRGRRRGRGRQVERTFAVKAIVCMLQVVPKVVSFKLSLSR